MASSLTFRPSPPRLPLHAGKSLAAHFVYRTKSEGGPCEQGQTAAETGCVPASGEGGKEPNRTNSIKTADEFAAELPTVEKNVPVLIDGEYETEKKQVPTGTKPIKNVLVHGYRVGSTANEHKRGTFFSGDEEGAEAYASLHPGLKVEEYTIALDSMLLAAHQNDVCLLLFGKPYGRMHAGGVEGGRKLDAKIAKELEKRGYNGVMYVDPAPPAKTEIGVFKGGRVTKAGMESKPKPPSVEHKSLSAYLTKDATANKPAPPTAKPGFTGKRKEGEREICRKDGKVVPCAPGEEHGKEKTQAEPGKQANPAGAPAQGQGNDQAVGNGQPDYSDPKFAAEWEKEVEKHIDEIEQGNVTQFDFSPEQVAAEQDWHSEFIEWRWGLGKKTEGQIVNAGKVQISPADVGPASRFISGLLNALTGGPAQAAKLKQMIPKDQQREADAQGIGDELQAFFDGMAPGQDNREAAELVSQVIGPQALAIAKVLGGGQKAPATVEKPEATPALTDEALAAMTPAERSEAVAAEREARTAPESQQREAAKQSQTQPSKPHATTRIHKAQQKARGKERNRQNETEEERIAREAIEKARLKKKRAAQEARMEKYRAQDRKKAEKEAKAAGKKGSKSLLGDLISEVEHDSTLRDLVNALPGSRQALHDRMEELGLSIPAGYEGYLVAALRERRNGNKSLSPDSVHVGDTIVILGKPSKVIDFGMWPEMKRKYPSGADRAVAALPSHLTEDKLGRTWAIEDSSGDVWLLGKAALSIFASKPQGKTLSWLNEGSGGALVAPPAHPFAPKPKNPKIKRYRVGNKVLWWR